MREQIAVFCIVVLQCQKSIPDHTVSAIRPERDSLSPSEWRPDEKMRELSPSPHFSILSEYLLRIRGPFRVKRIHVSPPLALESSHGGSRGSGSGGERLDNALIQLVPLESRNPPFPRRLGEGGEDSEEMPPK